MAAEESVEKGNFEIIVGAGHRRGTVSFLHDSLGICKAVAIPMSPVEGVVVRHVCYKHFLGDREDVLENSDGLSATHFHALVGKAWRLLETLRYHPLKPKWKKQEKVDG